MSRGVNTRCLGDEALEELKVAIEHVCRPQTIGIRLDQGPGKRVPQLERVRRVLEDVHFHQIQQMFVTRARERIVLSCRAE